MKTLAIIAVTGALASPALTFAQTSNEPVTRAQVRSELIQLEQAGYDPALSDNAHYPAGIQAAEAKVSAQNDAQLAAGAMGGVPAGSTASGAPAGAYGGAPYASPYVASPARATYGAPYPCVAPHSFCNPYSGS